MKNFYRIAWNTKWVFSLAAALIVAVSLHSYSVADANVDAAEGDMQAVETLAQKVFINSKYTTNPLFKAVAKDASDDRVEFTSPDLIRLIHSMQSLKEKLEAESDARADLVENDPSLASLFAVAKRYYAIQVRLYANYAKNMHHTFSSVQTAVKSAQWALKEKDSTFTHATFYDSLDLSLSPQAGAAAANDDESKNNLWHAFDSKNALRVMYGLTTQSKVTLEEVALKGDLTERNYAKAVLLSTIRERTANYWALQRMTPTFFYGVQDPNMSSCAVSDLLSFQDPRFYSTFSGNDRYEELNGFPNADPKKAIEAMSVGLAEKAYAPLLNQTQITYLFKSFFNYFVEYREDPFMKDYFTGSTAAAEEKKFFETTLPADVLKRLHGQWFDENAITHLSKGRMIVTDSNFPADSGDLSEIATRIVADEYIFQRRLWLGALLDQMETHVQTLVPGAYPTGFVTGKLTNAKAQAVVFADLMLKDVKEQWQNDRITEVVAFLKSERAQKIHNAWINHRFDLMANKVAPAYARLAKNYYAREVFEAKKRDNAKSYQDQYNLTEFSPELDSPYVPSQAGMTSITMVDPEALSLFYYKKLTALAATVTRVPVGIQPRFNQDAVDQARGITHNDRVQNGIRIFFTQLTDAYAAEIKKRNDANVANGLKPDVIDQSNSPLYDLILPTARTAYADFLKTIKNPDHAKKTLPPAAALPPLKNYSFAPAPTAAADQLAHAPVLKRLPKKYSRPKTFILPTADHLAMAKKLKVQPVIPEKQGPLTKAEIAKINSQPRRAANFHYDFKPIVATQDQISHPPVDLSQGPYARNAAEEEDDKRIYLEAMSLIGIGLELEPNVKLNKPLYPLYLTDRAGGLLETEHFLKSQIEKPSVREEVAMSLADQSIAAEVNVEQVLSQNPVLNQTFDFDQDEDPFYLRLIKNGNHGVSSHFRADLNSYFKTALSKQYDLVPEACSAKPFTQNDEAFRKVFRIATTYRHGLAAFDATAETLDMAWMKNTRSGAEVLEGYIDPVAQLLFYASLADPALRMLPMALDALIGKLAVSSFKTGVESFVMKKATAEAIAIETGTEAPGKNILMRMLDHKLFHSTLSWTFRIQTVLMGYVNFIELPQELRYQFGVQNSDVGIFDKQPTTRKAMQDLADEMHSGQWGTGQFAAFQSMELGSYLYRLNRARAVFGAKALTNLGKASAESQEIVDEITAEKSILRDETQEKKDYGRRLTVNEKATPQLLNRLITLSISKDLPLLSTATADGKGTVLGLSDIFKSEATEKLVKAEVIRKEAEAVLSMQQKIEYQQRFTPAGIEKRIEDINQTLKSNLTVVASEANDANAGTSFQSTRPLTLAESDELAKEKADLIDLQNHPEKIPGSDVSVREKIRNLYTLNKYKVKNWAAGRLKTQAISVMEKSTGFTLFDAEGKKIDFTATELSGADLRAFLLEERMQESLSEFEFLAQKMKLIDMIVKAAKTTDTAEELSQQFFSGFSKDDFTRFEQVIKSVDSKTGMNSNLRSIKKALKQYRYLSQDAENARAAAEKLKGPAAEEPADTGADETSSNGYDPNAENLNTYTVSDAKVTNAPPSTNPQSNALQIWQPTEAVKIWYYDAVTGDYSEIAPPKSTRKFRSP